jgi:hypothetical protein
MGVGAQLSVTDLRRASRHPVDHPVIGEHRRLGDVHLRIVNLSAQGFMVEGTGGIERGERVVIRLPVVGRIEAHMIWVADQRAGFQFERIIRLEDFVAMVETLQPNARLRNSR